MEPEPDQRPIEQQFLESWDDAEVLYADLTKEPAWIWVKPIFGLIREFRSRGYDQQVHAGHRHWELINSRTRKAGHYFDYAHLMIIPRVEGGMTISYCEPPEQPVETEIDRVELTPELDELLQRLLTHPIT